MFYRKFSAALCAGIIAIALGGCEKEGPMERAGEKVDEALEGGTKGPMERAGEKVDKATEKAGEAVEDAGKEMQGH